MIHRKANRILPVIIISQFACTSLWFAGNAVMPGLVKDFHLTPGAFAHLTAAVQFGFISGTLVFALLAISDRFSPSLVFLFSAIVAATANFFIPFPEQHIGSLLALRFLTGFFLAGIYPVGMKIASDHYDKGLGKALGFLVGALVLGTAFPHLLKSFTESLPWKLVLFITSGLSVMGGLLMFTLVPDGPYRKSGQGLNFSSLFKVFRNKNLRSAAFGYFGHMWELYAFWAFLPFLLVTYQKIHPEEIIPVSFFSFIIISLGGLACVASGYFSQKYGSKKIAFIALLLSCACCILSPLFFSLPFPLFLAFLIFWGLVVIADSPMFSTLVAQNAPAESKGTALTIVNCIGFSITILSIELINALTTLVNNQCLYLFLGIGPVLGLLSLSRLKSSSN